MKEKATFERYEVQFGGIVFQALTLEEAKDLKKILMDNSSKTAVVRNVITGEVVE